jgi:predicted  nucleic acid-binding Zn-ribbon protein
MILVENNWENIYNLQDVSRIIREYYNRDLAEELDRLIPEHTDEEYNGLAWEFERTDDQLSNLTDEWSDLISENERLENKIKDLENELEELNNRGFINDK